MSALHTSLLSFCLVSAVAGCAVDTPESDDSGELPTTVSLMPRVDRLTLHEGRLDFVAGDLGQELPLVAESFQIEAGELALVESQADSLGIRVERFQQKRNGLDVIGGDLRITRSADNTIRSATASSWGDAVIAEHPKFGAREAKDLAMAVTDGASAANEGRLVYLFPSSGKAPALAWHYELRGARQGMPVRDDVFIDATEGGLLDRHPHVHSARLRETYDANGQEQLGQLARDEGSAPSGNADVDRAHDAAGITYDCLQALFQRDSYDGAGGALISVANFGQNFDNAFWDGVEMVYGAGFAVSDVGTHEFVHGVTERTANMVYQNEPGALNEAWSDIMAAVCDSHSNGAVSNTTWTIGEALPINALRFMNNPTQDGISSDHYSTRYLGQEDEGGVHLNSGIANLAFYLLSEGGVHPRNLSTQQVQGMGISPAATIFYRALTTYMNVNTDFAAARTATEQAAVDLFGADSSESISVSEAWAAVGVGGPPPVRSQEPPPGDDDDGTGDGTGDGDGTGTGDGDGTDPTPTTYGDVVGGCSTSGRSAPAGAALMMLALCIGLGRGRRRG